MVEQPEVVTNEASADPGVAEVLAAAVEVLREKLFAFGMFDEVGKQVVEVLLRHFAIPVPPNRIPGEIVDDRVLVFRAAAGVVTGLGT